MGSTEIESALLLGREKDFAVFFIVLWSLVGKYALICAMDIPKIQMVVHICQDCFIYRTNVIVLWS